MPSPCFFFCLFFSHHYYVFFFVRESVQHIYRTAHSKRGTATTQTSGSYTSSDSRQPTPFSLVARSRARVIMKTKSASRSFCAGRLLGIPAGLMMLASTSSLSSCYAFVVLSNPLPSHCHGSHHHDHKTTSPPHPIALQCTSRLLSSGASSVGAVLRRTRNRSNSSNTSTAMSVSASSGSGESAAGRSAYSPPSRPGAGVIDLKFRELKAGGFKVFLLFFLLGVSLARCVHYDTLSALLVLVVCCVCYTLQ